MTRLLDLLGATYFFGLASAAILVWPGAFAALTRDHPFAMGFLKFALLATFGEHLKRRLAVGRWAGEGARMLLARAAGWGLFGVWFAMVFPLFSAGVDALVALALWPAGPPLWLAFSKSLWINVLGLYGWTMMLAHEWLNACLAAGRPVALPAFAETLDRDIWFGRVPRTILLFWVPAHTVTFSLPGEWRILSAAALSVALGFLLSRPAPRDDPPAEDEAGDLARAVATGAPAHGDGSRFPSAGGV